ncbi:MAG: hypothetical protein JOZ78_13525 [Chroococcidiopsidaceae cyanobacterium CP_BM_ER_R8_30]|nr:hypothetical protein [Chroococcidiopsidaceae cyanobacterium CP_BM_ER_R8_30]
MNSPSLTSTPAIETHLATQAVLYPTLRHLVELLPLNHRQIREQLQQEADNNPFLIRRGQKREALLEDVLPDWYNPISAEPNLQEHLRGQIGVLDLPRRQREALIDLTRWLSPSGYLEETPEVWAQASIWSAADLEAMIPYLQRLDPPGIGARSLQECLLLQLQAPPDSLVRLLIENYLEDIADCIGTTPDARQHQEALLKQLPHTVDLPTLETAIQQIQALEPRPGRHFSHHPAAIVTPDLRTHLDSNQWQVSLAYEVSQDFCLNEETVSLLSQSKRNSRERQRLEALLQKAQNLLTALNQWQENLIKVGEFLVDRQQAFLASRNPVDLVPSPQQLIAQMVGLSNATISRIVRERYLLIAENPTQTIPLQALCSPASVGGHTPQEVQHLIVQLVAEESPTNPYSDDQLAQLLNLRYRLAIARRTVMKYRQLAGIDSSHQRKISNLF